MSKTIIFFVTVLSFLCCKAIKTRGHAAGQKSKGVIVYHGDHFFLYKIKNKKMTLKNVTWPYLYANIEHTGYSLDGMAFASIKSILPHFKGIRLNADHENIIEEFKYLYVAPVDYRLKFMDTTLYSSFGNRKFNLQILYKGIPYLDFNYRVYPIDTCAFSLWRDFTLSAEFDLNIDSMAPLLEELPPSVFKD